MTVQEFWTKLEEVGWLREATAAEIARLRLELSQAFTRDPRCVFYSLAVASFDPECIEGVGVEEACSYHSVITQLARASDGEFSPTNVRDELDAAMGTARVSFDHGGETFVCEVPWEDDWFQFPVLDLVNEAIATHGSRRRFIPLPACDQTVALVLVAPEVYEKAVDVGLIPRESFVE